MFRRMNGPTDNLTLQKSLATEHIWENTGKSPTIFFKTTIFIGISHVFNRSIIHLAFLAMVPALCSSFGGFKVRMPLKVSPSIEIGRNLLSAYLETCITNYDSGYLGHKGFDSQPYQKWLKIDWFCNVLSFKTHQRTISGWSMLSSPSYILMNEDFFLRAPKLLPSKTNHYLKVDSTVPALVERNIYIHLIWVKQCHVYHPCGNGGPKHHL